MLLLGKPVLDGDIFSLNPSKLAQLLPERLQEDRATRSSTWIQETYAEDFPCLLRLCPHPAHRECDDDCKNPRPFSILDPSVRLRVCPEFIEGTGFRFPIVGNRIRPSHPNLLFILFSLIENRQSKTCPERIVRILCYLITLSARASTFGGIVRPICFAAFRLMTAQISSAAPRADRLALLL